VPRPRAALLATGVAFALVEAVDAFFVDVPAFAVLFAALLLACTAWYWRRDSARAAVLLLVLFAFEVAEAPTWDAPTAVKVGSAALGVAGLVAAVAVLVARRRVAHTASP
jgi:hypothetical protein